MFGYLIAFVTYIGIILQICELIKATNLSNQAPETNKATKSKAPALITIQIYFSCEVGDVSDMI